MGSVTFGLWKMGASCSISSSFLDDADLAAHSTARNFLQTGRKCAGTILAQGSLGTVRLYVECSKKD